MLGSAAPFDYIHNFWSDQYEHTLQYVGHATKWDDFAVRGNLEERKAVGFYLLAGVVRAAIGFDRGGDPEYDPTPRWQPAPASSPGAPSPAAAR
jgi:3-phenylpropionate/trans-cinnamate dioxygenase ferredoxin reductase subunit